MKKFNITGLCVPNKHYMVDVNEKLDSIIRMIEDEEYFTINRARQYGKTTTFFQLDIRLQKFYTILSLSFEGVGSNAFSGDEAFVRFFIKKLVLN